MTITTGTYKCPTCNTTVTVTADGKLNFTLPRQTSGGRRLFPVPGHNCEFAKRTDLIDFSKLEKVG